VGDVYWTYPFEDASHYLVNVGIGPAGVDYLPVEEYNTRKHSTHHILPGAGVVIVKGLDLTGISPGDYELLFLPLKLKEAGGALARVFPR